MKLIGIIPARYSSSRFPGKPLAILGNKPLLCHVYQSALSFNSWEKLVVATDDQRISHMCELHNIPYIMTSSDHEDCIDRAWEVAEKLEADRYIVIQGDEPFFDSSILNTDLSPSVVNFYTQVTIPEEIDDPNVVKVVVSRNLKAIYFSRNSIPYAKSVTRKSGDMLNIDKQIGVYSFSINSLRQFHFLGMSYLEGIEGIGLLRFLENDIDVYMRYSPKDSISIDTEEDLGRAERLLNGAN
jgi:3-deoxy-manno-octulosonate cytidylyltransferase (CMP-KDO synthetase)